MAGGYCYIRREHRGLERKVRDGSVHARRHPKSDPKVAIGLDFTRHGPGRRGTNLYLQ